LTSSQWRSEGSEWLFLDYGRMDLLGTANLPAISGYTIGGDTDVITSTNVSEPMRGYLCDRRSLPALLTVPYSSRFEIFDTGTEATLTNPATGQVFDPAVPSFDLRFTGNDRRGHARRPPDLSGISWLLSKVSGYSSQLFLINDRRVSS
jgi:hypothetical protein